jgi:type III pantothenate kinase
VNLQESGEYIMALELDNTHQESAPPSDRSVHDSLQPVGEFLLTLVFDIGNTSTHIGITANDGEHWKLSVRLSSDTNRPADEWYSLIVPHLERAKLDRSPSVIAIASVVPEITDSIVEMCQRYLDCDPLLYSHQLELGITVKTAQPERTGADRVVNAAMAFKRYGGPVAIIDMGTATKIDFVDRSAEFRGGAIAPGLGLSIQALASKTAKLFSIPLSLPESAIGFDTSTALQSGVVLGHLLMIEGILERIRKEVGEISTIVLTGGYAVHLAPQLERVALLEPTLTLDGLLLMSQLNPRRSP